MDVKRRGGHNSKQVKGFRQTVHIMKTRGENHIQGLSEVSS